MKTAHHTELEVGDLVQNVPLDKFGLIVKELNPITCPDGTVAERVFMVLYPLASGDPPKGLEDTHLTGSTFLKLMTMDSGEPLGKSREQFIRRYLLDAVTCSDAPPRLSY